MNPLPTFHLGLMNAWWLSLPLVLSMAYIGATKKEVARRMSDMTGYSFRERFFTVSASLAPYPFIIASAWTPFTTFRPFLFAGLVLYAVAASLFFATLRVFVTTHSDKRLSSGPFRFTRNPLYVAYTAASRPPIPMEVGHPFRSKPATYSD
jgi:protein-S-isoprenylcysteine O-methyltransferase Ste14